MTRHRHPSENADRYGCATSDEGEEFWEEIVLPGGRRRILYEYRSSNGGLFTTIANSLENARRRRTDWMCKQRAWRAFLLKD